MMRHVLIKASTYEAWTNREFGMGLKKITDNCEYVLPKTKTSGKDEPVP